jgi:hypothetical protein
MKINILLISNKMLPIAEYKYFANAIGRGDKPKMIKYNV